MLILSLILWLCLVGSSVAQSAKAQEHLACIYSPQGNKVQAVFSAPFPLLVETSALVYDPDDSSFFTTADKGEPHLIQFRLVSDSIEILRAGVVQGLDGNYDFEGVELVRDSLGSKLLMISTERLWEKDSLVCFGVDTDSFALVEDRRFRILPLGAGRNNNLEGICHDPTNDWYYVAKERGPCGLYAWSEPVGQIEIFRGSEFEMRLMRFLFDSMAGKVSEHRLESLGLVSLSGLAFDRETGHLLMLNRYGRSVIELDVYPQEEQPYQILSVLPFEGIDCDFFTLQGISDRDRYGLAEGLAVFGNGDQKKLAIITDPGANQRPHLFVFPYLR